MSTTLSVGTMVLDIQNRIPMNLDSTYIISRLNESFRWIAQQGSFVWNLRREQVAVDPNTIDFPLPSAADVGDLMSLYGASFQYEIPYIPFDRWSQQQVYNFPSPTDTPFSAWTIIAEGKPGVPYMVKLAPDTQLAAAVTLNLFYHGTVEPVINPLLFFPTPDEFDSMIVDITEGEIKRRYNLGGWQDIQAKAVESAKRLMDAYRSSKSYIQGLADQAVSTQEAQVRRAE